METEVYRPIIEMSLVLLSGAIGLGVAIVGAKYIWRKRNHGVQAELST